MRLLWATDIGPGPRVSVVLVRLAHIQSWTAAVPGNPPRLRLETRGPDALIQVEPQLHPAQVRPTHFTGQCAA
jgi:hypothetical protein